MERSSSSSPFPTFFPPVPGTDFLVLDFGRSNSSKSGSHESSSSGLSQSSTSSTSDSSSSSSSSSLPFFDEAFPVGFFSDDFVSSTSSESSSSSPSSSPAFFDPRVV